MHGGKHSCHFVKMYGSIKAFDLFLFFLLSFGCIFYFTCFNSISTLHFHKCNSNSIGTYILYMIL